MIAVPLVLEECAREELEMLLRASLALVALLTRNRTVLLTAAGLAHAEVCCRVGVSGPTVLT